MMQPSTTTWSSSKLSACDLTPSGMLGWPLTEVGGVEAGWAGQAAFAVVGSFFLGLLAGFLIAG